MDHEDFHPMTIAEYSGSASKTDKHSDSDSLNFPLLGLFGEVGSLLSEVKKKQRDSASYLGYAGNVVEELGDVLWYLSSVARRGAITLSEVAVQVILNRGSTPISASEVTFEMLQPNEIGPERHAGPTPQFEATLLELAGAVGSLLSEHHSTDLKKNPFKLAGHLTEILEKVILAATEAGVTLEAAAIKNISKIFNRWPIERKYPALFDEESHTDERFPRELIIDIYEAEIRGQPYVFQRCNGLFVGDRLTDNSVEPDDYRFHDVFHLANMAILGWSPVIRALLKLKRKREPAIDETQDGARAILIEEGITTWIFSQAQQLDYFSGIQQGQLPLDMLRHARQFAIGYDPFSSPLWLWEEAVLEGYKVFRFIKERRRGRVSVDLINRRIQVAELPA